MPFRLLLKKMSGATAGHCDRWLCRRLKRADHDGRNKRKRGIGSNDVELSGEIHGSLRSVSMSIVSVSEYATRYAQS